MPKTSRVCSKCSADRRRLWATLLRRLAELNQQCRQRFRPCSHIRPGRIRTSAARLVRPNAAPPASMSSSTSNSAEDGESEDETEKDETENGDRPDGPRQQQIQREVEETEAEIAALSAKRSVRALTDAERKLESELLNNRKQLQKKKDLLKRNADAARKLRDKKRQHLHQLQESAGTSVGTVLTPGRPPIEVEQRGLQESILQIVNGSAGADGRRRTEKLEVCMTLEDLHRKLTELGFTLSKTALYYRLLPRRQGTLASQRHQHTVPVRLLRPTNSLRKDHPDGHFATATVKYLKQLAIVLGQDAVFFLSQDDKSRVPIGLAAANKQSCLLMHLQYRVQLPDHDWVVAERHKLIPLVYAACEVTEDEVSYSGATYIAIRSGKHDKSTAATHATDFNRLLSLNTFDEVAKTETGQLKPIVICTVDGGPDENPRFPKTLNAWSAHFKEHNLDALFVVTHAPGQSALNAVERRMAPLSHDLSGLILPHDAYGSHLDSQGRTVDLELERRNFEKAGTTLADVWSQTVVHGCPVTAEYITPTEGDSGSGDLSEKWIFDHVQQSQYLLQIVRCNNRRCCSNWRTNYFYILPSRYLPAPIRFFHSSRGIETAPIETDVGRFGSIQQRLLLSGVVSQTLLNWDPGCIPFDAYCPSVRDSLADRICPNCSSYFATAAAKKRHKRSQVCGMRRDDLDIEEDISDDLEQPAEEVSLEDDSMPIPVRNLFDQYAVGWEYE